MTANTQPKNPPANGLEKTKELMQQISGHIGPLKPLVSRLEQLLEDPVLKKTLEEMPAEVSRADKN